MPNPVGWVCKACQNTWKSRPNKSGKKQCPKCQSGDTERLIPSSVLQVEVADVTITKTPVVVKSVIPDPPTTPLTLPASKAVAGKSTAITPDVLLAAKAKLKPLPPKVVAPVALPGIASGKSAITDGIRIIASKVQNGNVGTVRLKRQGPSWDKSGRYYCLNYPNRNIAFAFKAIAEGKVNADHHNFNTRYWNAGSHLPSRSTPFSGPRGSVAYFEYGWKTNPPHRNWCLEDGKPAPKDIVNALDKFLDADGNFDIERVMIDQTGEVFYTPDHYYTFFRYHFGMSMWSPYFCHENFQGTPDWDVSVYQLK